MTLADDIQADLGDVFFNDGAGEFETAATYTPVGGSAVSITGIYDDETIADQADVEVGERGSQPEFQCKTADVPSAGHGDTLTVGSQAHKVVGVDKDGTGVTTLILEKQ